MTVALCFLAWNLCISFGKENLSWPAANDPEPFSQVVLDGNVKEVTVLPLKTRSCEDKDYTFQNNNPIKLVFNPFKYV